MGDRGRRLASGVDDDKSSENLSCGAGGFRVGPLELQLYAKTHCFCEFLTKSGTLKNGCTKSYLNYLQPLITPLNHVRIR